MNRTAKLFKSGRSQAVRLPAEFRFEDTEVEIRRNPGTDEVVLSPVLKPTGNWNEFFRLRALIPPEELNGFMDDREQGHH